MKVFITVENQGAANLMLPVILNYPWPPNSEFYLIHIVRPVLVNSYLSLLPSPLSESIAEQRDKEGHALVRNFGLQLQETWHSPNIHEIVLEGDPATEIIEQVLLLKPDLIVLGSHQRSGFRSLGSVSRSVLAETPSNVMVVPLAVTRHSQETTDPELSRRG